VPDAPAPEQETAAAAEKRRLLSAPDNPLVRAVGRLPLRVHTKMLLAFVGTAVLVVVVGLIGLRELARANDRSKALGALETRALAYGKLQKDALHLSLLLGENVATDYYKVNGSPGGAGVQAPSGRAAIACRSQSSPAST
jgi:hypothetical protein